MRKKEAEASFFVCLVKISRAKHGVCNLNPDEIGFIYGCF